MKLAGLRENENWGSGRGNVTMTPARNEKHPQGFVLSEAAAWGETSSNLRRFGLVEKIGKRSDVVVVERVQLQIPSRPGINSPGEGEAGAWNLFPLRSEKPPLRALANSKHRMLAFPTLRFGGSKPSQAVPLT